MLAGLLVTLGLLCSLASWVRWVREERALRPPQCEGVVEAIKEAVLNVLCAGETTIGSDGHRSPGFPVTGWEQDPPPGRHPAHWPAGGIPAAH